MKYLGPKLLVGTLSQADSSDYAASTSYVRAAISALGTLSTLNVGAGLTSASGNLSANVQSVATLTGAITATALKAQLGITTSDVSGLGNSATRNVGTTSGTVAAGDDSRITGALQASTAASTYAALASSPTFTGGTVASGTGAGGAGASFIINGGAGYFRQVRVFSGSLPRWDFGVNNASESGSQAGSDFYINAFNDDGSFRSTPFTIARATGIANFTSAPTISGTSLSSIFASLNSSPVFSGGTITSYNTAGAASLYLNPMAGSQSSLYFQDGGTTKWQVGKQGDNTFFIYDAASGHAPITISAADVVNLYTTPTINGASLSSIFAPVVSPSHTGGMTLAGGLAITAGVPGTTAGTLYNNGGNLYWNGIALATGASVSGTTGNVPVFTGSNSLGNSILGANSTQVSAYSPGNATAFILGSLNTGKTSISVNTSADAGGYGYLQAISSFGSGWGTIALNPNGGNVGVETISPAYALDIAGSGTRTTSLIIGGGGTFTAGSIYSDANWGMLFKAASSGASAAYAFQNYAGTELFKITNSGGFLFSGTQASQQWLTGIVTPEMYGAAGNGTTDDTSAVSSAINSGKPVYLPGKYLITSALSTTIAATSGFRMFGDGQRSQILLSGASTGITVNIAYTGNYAGQNGQVILQDFAIVEKTAGAGTAATASAGYGMLNLKAVPLGSGSFAGITADNLVVNNVSFLGDGTGWNYTCLLLQDLRFCTVSINAQNCIGGTVGTGGASGSAAIAFKTTNAGSSQNAPTAVKFPNCNITAGDRGIYFIASGGGTANNSANAYGTMDPQGIWITDGSIIGQTTASIDLNASDVNNAEWRVHRCTLNAYAKCINATGIGMPRFTENTFVVGQNSGGYGIYLTQGNAVWTAGQICSNVCFGQGGSTAVVGGSYNLAGGITNGFLVVNDNVSMNSGGGYALSGTAVKYGTNY